MTSPTDNPLAADFVRFSPCPRACCAYGEFKTKAGRLSPYFFNAGLFDDGAKLSRLAEFYARRLLAQASANPPGQGLGFDMLFGPAYKGITLAAGLAIELARLGHNLHVRLQPQGSHKDHGEGGTLVGAPVRGRVLIVDDVISAGTSVRESITMIRAAGGVPAGVAIALDRQERATHEGQDAAWSAVQYVQREYGLPVVAVATLADLMAVLQTSDDPALQAYAQPVLAYRTRYGV